MTCADSSRVHARGMTRGRAIERVRDSRTLPPDPGTGGGGVARLFRQPPRRAGPAADVPRLRGGAPIVRALLPAVREEVVIGLSPSPRRTGAREQSGGDSMSGIEFPNFPRRPRNGDDEPPRP